MRLGHLLLAAVGGIFATGLLYAAAPQTGDATAAAQAPEPAARAADREAIAQTTRAFAAAFEKGDAKALAALWSENGEYEDEEGGVLRGRAAIEAAFAAHFKGRPASKMEVQIEGIRFLSRDTAVEEGLTRTSAPDMLPASSYYRALHVREDGKWSIVQSREWGAAENRLADLDWLIGSWKNQPKPAAKDQPKDQPAAPAEQEMVVTFAKDKSGAFLIGEFTATVDGKPHSLGTMRIALDPVSGRFKSWHFDPDGGHGEGVWIREGKSWMVDSQGVQPDGVGVSSVNVLTRLGGDELGWRTIERTAGGRPLPDSAPTVLKRVAAK